MGNPGCRAGKTHLSIQIRQICILPSSWVKACPVLVLQISKATGWDYYLGTAGMNSVCRGPCAGCRKLHPLLCHRFPCNPHVARSGRGFCKTSHNAWGKLVVHWKNQNLRGDISTWCFAGLETVRSTCRCLACPSDAISLGLYGAGGCFCLTPMFRIFSVLSSSGIAIIIGLVNGSKAGETCCHLGDAIPFLSL